MCDTGNRIALLGHNGSGKSTFIQALMGHPGLITTGQWQTPTLSDIGYLDQNYATLTGSLSVLEHIAQCVPTWTHIELRRHLTDFLFRKNEEVEALAMHLSGREKVRLILAQIAVKNFKLLILDEITNNIDLDTRMHVIEVLKYYKGAMIVISHDEDFLKEIHITERYQLQNHSLYRI